MTLPPHPLRIAVVFSGDPSAPARDPMTTHWQPLFEALAALEVEAEAVVYADAVADAVRERLLEVDGVLVWVDPIAPDGNDRTILDALLRDVAASGVFVSTHPDVILKMGTKDVLVSTREMARGTHTRLYATFDDLAHTLPAQLASGARVLKQHRGNGGNGVWKVEAVGATSGSDDLVRVQHALRGAVVEELRLSAFLDRCRPYFSGAGSMIDQPYQTRLGDGMIRCYFVHDQVVGFGHHMVTALLPPPPGADGPPDPPARVYYGQMRADFQRLRRSLESGWIAEMQRLLEIERTELPVIWDADFLLGPATADGEDSYVLCEINVSCVIPMPDGAWTPLAEAAVHGTRAARDARTR